MKTQTFNTAQELKSFVKLNRALITDINGTRFASTVPTLEVTNQHASYYSPNIQGNEYLRAPFIVTVG